MFIYTTFTITKAEINRAHCSRILLISLSQISLFLHILYLRPIARTQYLTQTALSSSTFTLSHSPDASPLHYKLCHLWAQVLVAGEHQNPSLSSRCLAVIWLPRHPLTASLWHGSLAIRSLPHRDMAPSPSAHCLAMTWLPRHPLVACGITVLSLHLPKETPGEGNSMDRLSFRHWTLAYIALSHFPNDQHSSGQCYPSLSLECTRMFW
jgi:hypothetical protein